MFPKNRIKSVLQSSSFLSIKRDKAFEKRLIMERDPTANHFF